MTTLLLNSRGKLLFEYEVFFSFLQNQNEIQLITPDNDLYRNGRKANIKIRKIHQLKPTVQFDLIISLGWNPDLLRKWLQRTPLVVIATNRVDLENVLITPNLYKVVATFTIQKGEFAVKKIPGEYLDIVPFLPANNEMPGRRRESKKISTEIIFIPAEKELEKLMSACIPVFNLLHSSNITIVLPNKKSGIYSPFLSKHINISDQQFLTDHSFLQRFDLCIASEGWAKMAIRSGIPLILLGNNGLEGLVDDSRIESIMAYDFRGRAGGSILEDIPPILLENEILFFQSLNLKERTEHAKKIAQEVRRISAKVNPSRYLDDLIKKVIKIHELCSYSKRIPKFKATLANNVDLRANGKPDHYELYNRHTGQTLLMLNESQHRLLTNANMKRPKELDLERGEVQLKFLKQLFEKKAISINI
jgi:hypothetical protein